MPAPQTILPSIFLDYGADAAAAADTPCEICERGMRFSSQWQITPGAMLHIAFAFEDGGPCRIEAEGVVVECVSAGCKEHLTTLAFVETPSQLRDMLGKVSTRLAFHSRGPVSL